jgi:membrane associated rhomboid family serine protease
MEIRITPAVFHLLMINLLVFIAIQLIGAKVPEFVEHFLLTKSNLLGFRPVFLEGEKWVYVTPRGLLPYGPQDFHWYQVITYFFAHTSFFHFLFNMIALYSLGVPVESVLGMRRFLWFYLFCGTFAGVTTAIFDPSSISIIGASGAISGVAAGFALLFPHQYLMIFPIPIPVKAKFLVLGFAIFSLIMAIFFPYSGSISHFGHLMGLVGGYLYFRILRWYLS